ncbi:MAG TPA: hypothetical protein VII74_08255 [Chthoniobacterales bacterium]
MTTLQGFLRSPLVVLLFFSAAVARAEQPLQSQTEQWFNLPLDGSITIANTDGSIHIFGWYEPRVRLSILRRAYTAPRLRQIRVQTNAQPRSLEIRTLIPRASGLFADRSGTVDYTLNVPEPAHLKLTLANGEVTLQGLRGAHADISLTNGRITALDCFANVKAHSIHGVMEVFYQWWENLPAAFDYQVQQGRIGVILPPAAQFRVDAATANGRIGNGFGFKILEAAGPGQTLRAATSPAVPLSLYLRTGGGNISIDRR